MERTIEATTVVPAVPARVAAVLADDPGAVLASARTPEERRAGRFRTRLSVDLGGGTRLQQEVEIEVGPAVRAGEGGVALPVAWHSVAHDRLLPSFRGELGAVPDRGGTALRLAGTYVVPLGALGRFGDGVLGRRLARRSVVAFLEDAGRRLDAEVDRRISGPAVPST